MESIVERVMFIPDVHLTSSAPISRKETNAEYREVQYNKLKFCYDYCIEHNIKTIIYEGDFFNNSTSLEYSQLSDIATLICSYRDKIKSYSIVGNHDLYYRNTESNRTLLNLFFSTGILTPLTSLEFESFRITGFNYNEPIIKPLNKDKYNICVAHCFYENSFFGEEGNSNISENEALELGYNAYVLGHDHTYYEPVITDNYSVFRSGSLLRGTSKTDNLYRGIKVMLFEKGTDSKPIWTELDVPCKSGEEAFLEQKFIEKQNKSINLDDIISNLYSNEHNDIYEIIESNESNGKEILKEEYDKVIDLITQYLESFGIYKM